MAHSNEKEPPHEKKPPSAPELRRATFNVPNRLLSIIADEDTCVGFLMAGIGEINKMHESNFMVVDNKTDPLEIEECFLKFTDRADVAVILINQYIADRIRKVVDAYDQPIPAVLEIPSRDNPYDPEKDSLLKRAKRMVNPDNL